MANRKRAIITGIQGQDGQLLAKLLNKQKYEIVGTSHRGSAQISVGGEELEVRELDLKNDSGIANLIRDAQADEIYCLAARASSADLSSDPVETTRINGVSCLVFLEAIRRFSPQTRLCFASSSEVFAGSTVSPQSEETTAQPLNAYGVAKLLGMQHVKLYRQQWGVFACSAVLYNHESALRPQHFVSKKICVAAARISKGLETELVLGDLSAQRDWTYAGDTVRALHLMLQQPKAEDFVISSGKLHSVEQFCDAAFSHVGLKFKDYVKSVLQPDRRPEKTIMLGNPTKAKLHLGWTPQVSFEDMIGGMVDHELAFIESTQTQKMKVNP